MKPTFDHNLPASFYLWLDHLLLDEGQAYRNYSGNFISGISPIESHYAYVSPHRQWVYDSSVSGASIPNGVFVGASGYSRGTDGLILDFNKGEALFNSPHSNVSGTYAFKEVNLYFPQASEEKVLFEERFVLNNRTLPNFTGYLPTDKVYPCIFIKYDVGTNETIDFCGLSSTLPTVRCIFLADTQYLFHGVTSLLRDSKESYFPIFPVEQLPFNEFGDLTGVFNYENAANSLNANSDTLVYIKRVYVSPFSERINQILGREIIGGIVDLDLEILRFP